MTPPLHPAAFDALLRRIGRAAAAGYQPSLLP
jgi:hypothetical protein